ncbi:DUF647-domain-containing protein [Gonapodya prolifera JEL478]|uniref:DUF647-domain-containing protein n=1 Tax=Gonapodya prolifera (strain JEL478) TaxID=1344416 RepID=A0A139ADN6_GONPJ|nr:DUF647-domain-containing protein [Gonapodya prolifera JEL478]|eukprot:KXS14932.1 DUF647-domain-containing protein [Gonapodya prolifera JEL478]
MSTQLPIMIIVCSLWTHSEEQRSNSCRGRTMGMRFQPFRSMFLPLGYPESVHSTYARFHAWQFIETMIGSSVGVLCSQSMLASLGAASSSSASETLGGAVAIQWILKDGFGELGKLAFIQRFSGSFDSHPKTWKLAGECMSLIGSSLQLATLLVLPSYFLPVASLGYAFRAVHYTLWGASHTTFARHFSTQSNLGDVVAKDDSQMTVAHLLGLFGGTTVLGLAGGNPSAAFLYGCFAVMGTAHFGATVMLVRGTGFEILNQARLQLLAAEYVDLVRLRESPAGTPGQDLAQLSDPDVLKLHEGFVGEWLPRRSPNLKDAPNGISLALRTDIKLGVSVARVFRDLRGRATDLTELKLALEVMKDEQYVIQYGVLKKNHGSEDAQFFVTFRDGSKTEDVVRSILHATFLSHLIQNLGTKSVDIDTDLTVTSLAWRRAHEQSFVAALKRANWDVDTVYWTDEGVRGHW